MRKALIPLMLAFTVAAGCGESQADKNAKPDVIKDLTEVSYNKFDAGPENPETYAARLAEILKDVDTRDLKLLQSLNIDIALDQTLSRQNTGFFDKECIGVFVRTHADAGVLKLWDNGATESSFWNRDAFDHGASVVEKLADYIRDNGGQLPSGTLYAGRYSCGKNCTTTKIRSAEDFDSDTQEKNPELAKPHYKQPQQNANW